MPKLEHLQQKNLTPADELRQLLHGLEERQVRLKQLPAESAWSILHDLDQVETLFTQLQETGLDSEPEQGRFQTVQLQLQKQAKTLLKLLGGPMALNTQRPSPSPSPERWWWFIDEQVARQHRQQLRRLAIGTGVVVLLLGVVYLLFQTVLAPSPEAVARLEAENNAFVAIEAGNNPQALAKLELGLTKAPGDPELLLIKGLVEERLGDSAAAARSLAQAETGMNNPLVFNLTRGQLYLQFNQLPQAETAIRAALKLDENSARAWLLLGQVLEGQNQRAEALDAYEKAGDLAQANSENEVYVMSRMALARLLGAP
jgi:tetratricopeptide (TPR) repeat protein